jgi:hypothetical protein
MTLDDPLAVADVAGQLVDHVDRRSATDGTVVTLPNGSRFRDGDRVIVVADNDPKFVNLRGFYGHVRGHYGPLPCDKILVPVMFEGCLATAPGREHAADVVSSCDGSDGNTGKPFPMWPHELEHID